MYFRCLTTSVGQAASYAACLWVCAPSKPEEMSACLVVAEKLATLGDIGMGVSKNVSPPILLGFGSMHYMILESLTTQFFYKGFKG